MKNGGRRGRESSAGSQWVLIAACCVLSGVRGQYGPVRAHLGPALAFSPAAGFAGAAYPYAASAAEAALSAGAGATQLTLAPAPALFGHAHQQQQFAAAPGFSPAFLGAGYGAQPPPQLIVSPLVHQDGTAGLVPAGAPNFARTVTQHYGGGGSSQVTRYQPTTYAVGGANAGAATSGVTSRTQYQTTQLQTAPGSTSALYREPKQLQPLSSLSQVQAAGAPAVTYQEVGQTTLGALQGYGGAGTAGLFSGYGAAAAYPTARTAGYGAGLRAY
ncbi:elastin isoform X1 [Rhipicephalus sanguineus]|uniref:elastin isoform X1 n=1 Tax=Rhipicephalus sanguineus TaxID=34632 RepID=UPI00189350A2|nr:elastin isoform X1 [Rhipicephalus sanguineus]